MGDDVQTAWTEVYCLRPYNPYRLGGEPNPHFVRALDGRLLDFKQGDKSAIKLEAEGVLNALQALKLPKGTILAIVPGHQENASNAGRPLARLVEAIELSDASYVASIDTLIRVKTVPKKAGGGSRDLSVDLNSIKVQTPPLLAGATVVVIDDTATTKGSIGAARALLRRAGAERIAAIAIACTVKYF